ncbi:hypothetical protein ACFXGT_20250 [Streptomyces sp. NPDC059352]
MLPLTRLHPVTVSVPSTVTVAPGADAKVMGAPELPDLGGVTVSR